MSKWRMGSFSAAILMLVLSPAYSVPTGLVHHWNFDEGPDWHEDAFEAVSSAATAYDSVGSADGSFQNMSSSAWISGVQFTGIEFDGVNDHLLAATDFAGVLGATSSLAYWVRTTGVSVPGVMGSDQIQWGGIDSSGKVTLTVDGSPAAVSASSVNDGEWHHVVITRNAATGLAQIYVDGALSTSATGASGVKSATFSRIGKVEGTGPGSGYFSGRLDQIHLFNTVIDSAMVQQLRDNHAPKTWEAVNNGTNAAPFTTASIFFNSYDVEEDTLSVLRYGQGTNGTVVNNGDGTFTYTADAGFTGFDSFVVVIEDGKGGFRRSAVRVSVIGDPGAGGEKRTTAFENFQAIQAGGADISLSGWRVPRAIDWESDGDNDLLVGHSGAVWRYTNTGNAAAAVFSAGARVQAAGSNISLSGSVLIALADMTGDGVDDLIAADNSRKIRIYRNTSVAGAPPVYAAAVTAKQPNNSDFVMPDQRFDVGDWDGDGLPDIIMGAWCGDVLAYLNVGSTSDPRYDVNVYEFIRSDCYNAYPRFFDISRDGVNDLLQGINWGSITYWFDPLLNGGLVNGGTLVVTDTLGDIVTDSEMKAFTDGAMVDFGDYNGDGVYDLLAGGHAGTAVFIAYGNAETVADCIAENESIYDAHPADLGTALEANSQELLNVINANSRAIISHMLAAPITERQQMFNDMAAHVQKYPFLQMGSPLNTTVYHHVPSIAGQNLMTLHQMLPDTPTHRTNVANAVGLTGTLRDIYLTSFLHVGENQRSSVGQRESVLEYMSHLPREIFPDSLLTLDHYWGDGRGGTVNSFRGAKNTFSSETGSDSTDGFQNDQDGPIEAVFGTGAYKGDYFTLVMGHEVTHSLDGYLNRCANTDLWRRKGLTMVRAGGPDIVAGSNGWIDWNATKAHFQTQGYWDGVAANWDAAWSNYWSTGPGSAWRHLSFMRGSIDWFFGAPQEALATQANQHMSHSEGRLVAAIDRYRRGIESGIEPMKANINECVAFIDYVSAGLNKVVMFDTRGVQTPYPRATYTITHARLVRNDRGHITRITVNDRVYDFGVDADGIVVEVRTNIMIAGTDKSAAFQNQYNDIDVLANDYMLEGGKPTILGFTQPSHGIVSENGDGTLRYIPAAGYYGSDSFTYTPSGALGQPHAPMTVNITVVQRNGILKETYTGISGSAVSDLTGSSKFPYSPDSITVVTSTWTFQNAGDNYGTRMSGWLTPSSTGTYTFWIASDDSSELRLSSDADPANAVLICSVSGYTNYQQWTKYPSQQSSPISLVAGQSYYIESLQKESSGSDHLSVAWYGPGLTSPRQLINCNTYIKTTYPPVPLFVSNPATKPAAYEQRAYTGTLSDTIASGYGTIEFSKISGPGWLAVAADGTLTGIATDVNTGPNAFIVRAVNDGGAFADLTLNIAVYDLYTGELGLSDLAGLAGFWLSNDCVDQPECGGADLSGDGDVDLEDTAILGGFWMQ